MNLQRRAYFTGGGETIFFHYHNPLTGKFLFRVNVTTDPGTMLIKAATAGFIVGTLITMGLAIAILR